MTTEYKVEMPSPKHGWDNPVKIGTAEAETQQGAIMEVMDRTSYEELAHYTGYATSEAESVYGDGIYVRATPVTQTKELFVVRDEEAGRWYFDEKPE